MDGAAGPTVVPARVAVLQRGVPGVGLRSGPRGSNAGAARAQRSALKANVSWGVCYKIGFTVSILLLFLHPPSKSKDHLRPVITHMTRHFYSVQFWISLCFFCSCFCCCFLFQERKSLGRGVVFANCETLLSTGNICHTL